MLKGHSLNIIRERDGEEERGDYGIKQKKRLRIKKRQIHRFISAIVVDDGVGRGTFGMERLTD